MEKTESTAKSRYFAQALASKRAEDEWMASALNRPAGLKRTGNWSDKWLLPDPRFQPIVRKAKDDKDQRAEPAVSLDSLTDEQARAFDRMTKWRNNCTGVADLLTMGGLAGVGKSTLLSLFAKTTRNTAFCCFAAKATDVLRRKMRQLGMSSGFLENNVRTIHSLIYIPIEDAKGGIVGWDRQDPEKLRQQFQAVVVDEASMVNDQMLADLQELDLPILAVGDHGQLPPVEGKGSLMANPDIKLEKIHRQAEGNPIIALAHQIRQTGHLPRYDTLPKDGAVRFAQMGELPELLRQLYKRFAVQDIALLTYTNATRQKLNRLSRRVWLGDRMDDNQLVPTDQVICLKNYKRHVFNGMRGTLKGSKQLYDHWFDASVDFTDHDLQMHAPLLRGQFGNPKTFPDLLEIQKQLKLGVIEWHEVGLLFDYGYALTVHKAQGSGFRAVILRYERPRPVGDEDFKRWIYTAATRAIDELYIVV